MNPLCVENIIHSKISGKIFFSFFIITKFKVNWLCNSPYIFHLSYLILKPTMNTIKYICFLLIYKVSCSSRIELNKLDEVIKEIDSDSKKTPNVITEDAHIQSVNYTGAHPIKEFTNISYSSDTKRKDKRVSPSKLIEEIVENKPKTTYHTKISRECSNDSSVDLDAQSIADIERFVQELEVLTERVFTPTKRKLKTNTHSENTKRRRLDFED